MDGRLIAIGDIHGHRDALETLLKAIEPTENDIIVTLGDYVDRGPDSRGVIDSLIAWGKRTRIIPILGNHEEMMLDVVTGKESHHAWLRYGGVDTLDSYQFSGEMDFLPPEHVEFFDSMGDYFVHEGFFFTHAAYDPMLDFEEQPIELLRWHSLRAGIPEPHKSGLVAVVGHTAHPQGQILDLDYLICLDTNCYGGGPLTAMELPSKKIWQSTPDGNLL